MVKKSINKKIEKTVLEYANEVCKAYKVDAIILFGSYASGNEREDSDIDIAIVTDDFKTCVFDEELKLVKLRRKIDLRIEPHLIKTEDYMNGATSFIKEIINTGIKVA